jgi:UDP-3-O-[3-hydroxymyristoyl] glucosamine N-acyltransferase
MGPVPRTYFLSELIRLLGGELRGSGDVLIRQVAPLDSAGPEQIAYFASDAHRHALRTTHAAALIVRDEAIAALAGRSCVVTPNPHAYFVRVASLLHPQPALSPGVHALASVHAAARVAASAEVSAFATVGEGAEIGERVFVGPGCHIGAGARVGDDSRLHANVTLYDRCIIGKRGVMNAGCVIGADGFGGALEGERWLKMPHIGRVVIGDDVEVGANTTIDRGAMTDTVIEDGVKLDNQIQIGHNVRIGAHTSIAGCAGIAGSARIGAHCVIGGAAMIAGHLQIADRVQISGGTVVASSIDKPGRYTGVYPSSEHRAWLKGAARVRRLGEVVPDSKLMQTRRTRKDDSK